MEPTVATTAISITYWSRYHGPQRSGRRRKARKMAEYWVNALALPHNEGGTNPPRWATTPLRAMTTNSLKMMMEAGQMETWSTETRARSVPVTRILSAVVSRNAP